MFEYVKLRNFKSFGEIEFDLTIKKNTPKQFVLVYGDNGIGKSNLASAFLLLLESLRTMDVRDFMQSILSEDPETLKNEDIAEIIRTRFKDIETLIKENKTVESTENMVLEFGFRLNEKSGRYIIETDNSQIVHEKLEFTLLKNKGIYCDITPNRIIINEKIFNNKTSYSDIVHACEKFWGKHSFLSILDHERKDKSNKYIQEQLSENFKVLIDFFSDISCKIKIGSMQEFGIIGCPSNILSNYAIGKIKVSEKTILDKTENMLNDLFKSLFPDITGVYYKKNRKGNYIRYKLVTRKRIAGKERNVDFSFESTGTQYVIELLPYMLIAVKGAIVIIDELDIGIHDQLVKKLVLSLLDYLSGQIIITTHNTSLMESEIPKESIYIIKNSEDGEKKIECITQIDNKIHPNSNIRDQYLKGNYTGLYQEEKIEFKSLVKYLD